MVMATLLSTRLVTLYCFTFKVRISTINQSLCSSGQIRVNEDAYEAQRQKLGDAFYPSAGDILTTGI
jgi:hypothetical protein